MALVGIELETLVSEPDALTTRPPPCAGLQLNRTTVTLLGAMAQYEEVYQSCRPN